MVEVVVWWWWWWQRRRVTCSSSTTLVSIAPTNFATFSTRSSSRSVALSPRRCSASAPLITCFISSRSSHMSRDAEPTFASTAASSCSPAGVGMTGV